MQKMTRHSRTGSLQSFLKKEGWQTEDNIIWERGNLKVARLMPRGWVLAKRDIYAPSDYRNVASGISISELEKRLKGD